jgi:hypothetical protein
MSVTLPYGRTRELTAPESGLATLTLKDGTEYGVRPTIQDSSPVESNRRDGLQERDNQLAYDGSRGNRAQERWPRHGHGFENESVLQGVRA